MFNGKIHYKWVIFHSYLKLPEGILYKPVLFPRDIMGWLGMVFLTHLVDSSKGAWSFKHSDDVMVIQLVRYRKKCVPKGYNHVFNLYAWYIMLYDNPFFVWYRNGDSTNKVSIVNQCDIIWNIFTKQNCVQKGFEKGGTVGIRETNPYWTYNEM